MSPRMKRAKQDDARPEPELVGSQASAEDALAGRTVLGNQDAEEDGPEDAFDVGQDKVMSLAVGVDEVLNEPAREADNGQQCNTGERRVKSPRVSPALFL